MVKPTEEMHVSLTVLFSFPLKSKMSLLWIRSLHKRKCILH